MYKIIAISKKEIVLQDRKSEKFEVREIIYY